MTRRLFCNLALVVTVSFIFLSSANAEKVMPGILSLLLANAEQTVPKFETEHYTIHPEGDTITAVDGRLILEIPAGAVAVNTQISISYPDSTPTNKDIIPFFKMKLAPVDLFFNELVTIKFVYDLEELPDGYHPAALQVCGIAGEDWQPLKTSVSYYKYWASTQVDSSGTFSVATMNLSPILPGTATISSMADLSTYAGYEGIAGGIEISGNDITNLNDLISLKWTSKIEIQGCPNLTDTSGLSSVKYVANYIQVLNNNALTSFSMPGLQSIGGNFWIGRQNSLIGINLSGLFFAGRNRLDNFHIYDNPVLEHLGNITALQKISGHLLIKNNAILVNLQGLNGLVTVGGPFGVSTLPALLSLEGIDNLEAIGRLAIYNCDALLTLGGMNNIQQVKGDAAIENNDSLNSLAGLNADINGSLRFKENHALSNFVGLGTTRIDLNLTLFNNDGIQNLEGLSVVQNLGGLTVQGCGSITTLTGLGPHASIGAIFIYDNVSLANVSGLESVSWAASVRIQMNKNLVNLDGLANLAHVDIWLIIAENEALLNINGLSSLTNVGGLELRSNTNLTSVDGLVNLTRLGWTGNQYSQFFHFIDNDDVETMVPLTHLTINPATGYSVPEELIITGNADLPYGDASAWLYVDAIGGEAAIGGDITIDNNG